MKKTYTAVAFFSLTATFAQDIIYQSDESPLKCKLVEVSDKRVRYKSLQNLKGPDRILEPDEVLMVFSENGNYVVYPLESSNAAAAMTSVSPTGKRDFDILVTTDQKVIQALIDESTGSSVRFKAMNTDQVQTMDKSKIVLILHKGKGPELITSPNDAVSVLKLVRNQVSQLLASKGADTDPMPVATKKAESPAVSQSTSHAQQQLVGNKDASTYGLSAEQFAEFKNKALVKTDEFTVNLQTIADVGTSREKANTTIDLTTGLFVNEDARVEVSNINSGVKNKYKIRSYLDRLLTKSSQYSKVELEFADISYASEFKKGNDGNYYAVITFVQTFKGFKDGQMVYGDVTERNATTILKLYEKDDEGTTKKVWDIFLADVGVVETRR